MSTRDLPDSTIVPDDMLALQRKRIAANQPEMDKLLEDMMDKPIWKTIAKAYRDGLVNMIDTLKTVSKVVHDMSGHQISFSVCPDEFCKTANVQINEGIKLIARASELEPKGEVKP